MIGLGCMRLSTESDRDATSAAAVIAAALAAGVELLDTADVYCHDDTDVGHNERLLAGARTARIVTKGGLTRPGGAWLPDGRKRHLAAAARASRDRLGVDAIDLYLLHAIDPKTSLATSVRALAALVDDGVARTIGVSNVTPTQLDEACAITTISAVEVELHPWNLDAIRGGLLARCADRGIELLAHRPLGGPAGVKRASRDPLLRELAARHSATPPEIVLAWLRSLGVTPLPGATTVATAQSAIRAQRLVLDDDAVRALRAHFLDVAAPSPRAGEIVVATDRSASRAREIVVAMDRSAAPRSGEIVVVLGMPASGKSTLAEDYVARGYRRLNRDDRGGSLLDLARALDAELAAHADASHDSHDMPVDAIHGTTRHPSHDGDTPAGAMRDARFVLDNTYPTRASRAPVIEVARRHGVAVRCIVVDTPIEQAQAHAAWRVLERCGGFDAPQVAREIRPGVQFRWRRDFEPPAADEGFASIEVVAPPRRAGGSRAGLIVELDGIVWTGRPSKPDQIALRDGVRERVGAWRDHVLGATLWRPGATADQIAALAARLRELLDLAIDVRCCPHPAGPPTCWCRKPLPGLGIALARTHDLDLARTIHVGRGPADRGFATRAGVRYADIASGFPAPLTD